MSTVILAIGVAAYCRIAGVIWLLAALTVLFEVVNDWQRRRLPDKDEMIPVHQVVSLLLICMISVATYVGFGVIFAAQGNLALMVFSLIWTFGVFLFISTTYSQFPVFSNLQLLPAAAVALLQMWVVRNTEYSGSSGGDWWVAALGMAVYASTTMEVAVRGHATSRELRRAQRTATRRLRDLETLTHRDSLTGLLNRRAFEERLDAALRNDPGRLITVFLVDLDGFKPINDSYSHEAGDAVLVELGRRMSSLPGGVLCARLGGDEFVLAADWIGSDSEAMSFGERIWDMCARPVTWHDTVLEFGASVGIARGRGAGSATRLAARADRAMYTAKSDPERSVVLYRKGKVLERASLQERSEMADALEHGQFQSFYQPKIDLRSGRTIGFEALARRVLPSGQVIGPGVFLPKLCEIGLMGKFTLRQVEQVVADIADWRARGLYPGNVSINIPESSLATLTGRRDLRAALSRAGDLTHHLVIEITEDVFIARSGGVVRDTVRQIRDMGISISLDDFGTGFASFQHLRDLRFDELKIDTSFVRDLGEDFTAEVLIRGVLDIARGLGVRVIAEGVETRQQRDRLLEMGCVAAQGFLWSEALPRGDVPAWLARQPVAAALTRSG